MQPYSATPLTEEQRAEVLRVMNECSRNERHNYRAMLDGARQQAQREAKESTGAQQADVARAAAAAYANSLQLLNICWPELPTL
jgi:ribosome recycling factor